MTDDHRRTDHHRGIAFVKMHPPGEDQAFDAGQFAQEDTPLVALDRRCGVAGDFGGADHLRIFNLPRQSPQSRTEDEGDLRAFEAVVFQPDAGIFYPAIVFNGIRQFNILLVNNL